MNEKTLEHQAALALTALAMALCQQRGIDGETLRMDFLEHLEGLAAGKPLEIGTVGREVASLMSAILAADRGTR